MLVLSQWFLIFVSVTLEGQENRRIRLTGNVVNASLELLTFEGDQLLRCVKFGETCLSFRLLPACK